MPQAAYKIAVYIPPEFAEKLMDSVTEAIEPYYKGYDRCFSITDIKGTWRPMKGSEPFDGRIGEISVAEEKKIEFIIKEEELKDVLRVIKAVHPYEEPAIDVIPCIGWKSILE